MKSKFAVAIMLLSLPALALAQAPQDEPGTDQRPLSPWSFELGVQGLFYGNFFQAPDGEPQEDVNATQGELRAALDLGAAREVYGRVNYLKYSDGLDSSHGGRLGFRGRGRPMSYDAYLDFQADRPTFDIGDVFDRADILTAGLDWGYRITRAWEVGLAGLYQQQSMNVTSSRDNDFLGGGASLRYRGFGSILSPEIGFMTGRRDVDDATQNYDQDEWYLQLRSSPRPNIYLSARWRQRERDYTTSTASASNFGRSDDRNQLALLADYQTGRHLGVNLYYATEDVDSSLPSRTFDTSLLGLGLTWRF
jgi:hypothetical protein